MGNDRVRELRKNTLIIAVSNICSKAIVFVLAPLYSFFLTTEQYGSMDLITTTISLLGPFVCFDIYEATFRYTSDKKYAPEKVLSSSFAVEFVGIAIELILVAFLSILKIGGQYVLYVGIVVGLETIISILRQFARGRSQMKTFAATSIVEAIVLLLSNGCFMFILKKGLQGWLISYLLSRIAGMIYLMLATKAFHFLSVYAIDRHYIRTFINFCIPLVPTATMWWIMNASDRYLLAFFIGNAATGIYSVANKLPSILSVFENVFYQSWQTTAINSLHDEHRDDFYSSILTKYILVFSIGTLAILVVVKPAIQLLFAPEYEKAWYCLPFLLLSVVFHAAGGNLGSLYTVFKQTKGALYSTIVGALTNIILNIFLIPVLGIVGAAITTLIGYVATYIYRWFDVRKFVTLRLNHKVLWPVYIALPVQCALYYWNTPLSYVLRALIALVVVLCNYKMLIGLIVRR